MSQSPPQPLKVRKRPIFTFNDSTRGADTNRLLFAFLKGGVVVNVAAHSMISSPCSQYLVVKLVVGPENPDDQEYLKLTSKKGGLFRC